MARLLIIALFSGVVAWFAARATTAPKPPAVSGGGVVSVAEDKAAVRSLRTPADFAEWARSAAKEEPGQSFAGWSNEELKAALDEGITKPFFGTNQLALRLLLAEWTRREPDAAWQWLLALRSESTRTQLSTSIASAWPRERGAEGLEMALAHPEIFASGRIMTSQPLVQKALEFAARSGPDAVEEMLVKIAGGGLQFGWMPFQFPQGFDFDALSRKPEMLRLLSESKALFATRSWMKADPEAAFSRLLEINREAKSPLGNALTPILTAFGDNQEVLGHAQWIAKRLGELDEAEQRQIGTAFARRVHLRPAVLREFLLAMPEGEARDEAALVATRNVSLEVGASIGYLDAVTDPAARIEALQTLLSTKGLRWGYDLSSAELEKLLQEKLGAWNASTEQTAELLRMAKEVSK